MEAHLGADDEDPACEEGDVALVKGLDDVDDADAVSGAVAEGVAGIGEDGDENVLFYVEGPGVEGEEAIAHARDAELRGGQDAREEMAKREGRDLNGDLSDDERLRAVGEELVQEGHEGAGEKPDRPHPEGPDGERRVVRVEDSKPDLLDRG